MLLPFNKSIYFVFLSSLVFLLSIPRDCVAVQISNDSTGDAAIVQYFSAKQDWQTFVRIINNSSFGVAAKVRFREAAKGRPILDFVIFLAPYDEWYGWTDANAVDGQPGIRTNDTSCIVSVTSLPSQVSAAFIDIDSDSHLKGAKFSPYAITGSYGDDNTSINTLDRLSEGSIEIIGLGQFHPTGVTPNDENFIINISNNSNTGMPTNCQTAKSIYTGYLKTSEQDLNKNFDLKNTLGVNAYLVNISTGQGAGLDPIILSDFSNTSLIAESTSTTMKPDMDSATSTNIQPAITRIAQLGVTGLKRISGGVDAVSIALMRTSVMNEWALKKAPNQSSVFKQSFTQWVLNFPTKQFYVDLESDPDASDDISPTMTDPSSANNSSWAPFQNEYDSSGACSPFSIFLTNNEGATQGYSSSTGLCYQTNVVSFGGEFSNKGLASKFSTVIPVSAIPLNPTNTAPASLGFARLTFTGESPLTISTTDGEIHHGLPVDGFMFYNYESNNQQSNYSTILSHKYYRSMTH